MGIIHVVVDADATTISEVEHKIILGMTNLRYETIIMQLLVKSGGRMRHEDAHHQALEMTRGWIEALFPEQKLTIRYESDADDD